MLPSRYWYLRDAVRVERSRAIAAAQSGRSSCHHLMTMQGHIQLHGPNGIHDCLVLEILGSSAGDLLDQYFCNERLTAILAKRIAKQILLGLCSLHDQGIAHGGRTCTLKSSLLPQLTFGRLIYSQCSFRCALAACLDRGRTYPKARNTRNKTDKEERWKSTRLRYATICSAIQPVSHRSQICYERDQNYRLRPVFPAPRHTRRIQYSAPSPRS